MKKINIIGMRFGRFLAIAEAPSVNGAAKAVCACDCGKVKTVSRYALIHCLLFSCGCLRRDKTRERRTKHGHSANREISKTYSCWSNMKKRCLNKNNPAYYRYGGRGIRVCQEWIDSFEAFLSDMGDRPSDKHSIDRIDNNGNYEPGNCRWATDKEQANNCRDNHLVTYNGETLTLTQWSEKTGIKQPTLRRRIKKWGDVKRAIETPIGESNA